VTTKHTKSLSRSIWTELVKGAKKRGEDPNFVLMRFACERLLYRLSVSRHAGKFVLKGAMLFAVWTEHPHRSTKDLDLLGYGNPDDLLNVFREICALQVSPDDALRFDPNGVRLEPIRQEEEYDGRRVLLRGSLGTLPVNVQVDIGFGDPVSPEPVELQYPVLLEQLPSPRLRTYPPETVIAEKFEAMVKLGLANSRMKDFYDVWVLSRSHSFNLNALLTAARATFERRGTPWPGSAPLALTSAFAADASKLTQWQGFLKRTKASERPALENVIQRLQTFLGALYADAMAGEHRLWSTDASNWVSPAHPGNLPPG